MPELQRIDYRGPEDLPPRRVPRAFVMAAIAIVTAAAGPVLWATALTNYYQRVEGYGAINNSPRATFYRSRCLHQPRAAGLRLIVVAAIVSFVALLMGRASQHWSILVIPLLLATLLLFEVAMYLVKEDGFP